MMQYFKRPFIEWYIMYFEYNVIEVFTDWQYITIESGNGLVQSGNKLDQ